MKRISRRMLFLLILIGVLVAGLCLFLVRYAINAEEWATFPGSPHVYEGSNLSSGVVTDRNGTLLLDNTNGRVYSEDADLRRATMHLLGDRFGYIASPALQEYADELVGFDAVTGLYGQDEKANKAVLTIDADVQKAALAAMGNRKGTVGVYNYKTGEILCAVSTPTYDPDHMPDVEHDPTGAYDGVYLNRFFQTTYVPGSIFKMLTLAAALENIEDVENRTFTCEGTWQVGADTVICHGTHGQISLQDAVAKSCNVVFGQLALELGADTMTTYAHRAGVGESLIFDGIRTAAGLFDLETAADSQIAWSGIGQHTNLVNACQYMTYMGAIAGGGQAAKPYLVREAGSGLLSGHHAKTRMMARVMEEETADILAQMMHHAVQTSYGQNNFPDLYVCAKSGTAELGEGTIPHATFAGFIRDEAYPLAFIVVVEHGGSGSATCTPIAGQVLKACVEAMDQAG